MSKRSQQALFSQLYTISQLERLRLSMTQPCELIAHPHLKNKEIYGFV